jgi:cellulose synthase/poly-beta-1,6-N-acetylglucosamine synthase-like glycosyltransferase
VTAVLVAIGVLVGLPGLLAAMHLGVLTVASWLYRERAPRGAEPVRFLVLIPAHNEELVIAEGLAAIFADIRAGDSVLVVADRCADRTAAIARKHGALVLERGPDERPGRAAARQAGLEHARGLEWDAVVMLDADSVIAPGFFASCERALATGADAVQARSESRRGHSLAAEASLAAFALQGITLPRGRDRLRLSVRLRGTGMAIRRSLALAHDFHAPASEDLAYTLDLILDGTRCRHVETARLQSRGENRWSSFGGQKVRYEAGRMNAARGYVPRLLKRAVRHRDAAALEGAWFLATPPFALAVVSMLVALGLTALAGARPVAAIFAAALAVLVMVLVTGLIQARAGLRTWLALLAAPWYLAWKTVIQLRALAKVLRRDDYFPPTVRVTEN